jgi:hypothetical protein
MARLSLLLTSAGVRGWTPAEGNSIRFRHSRQIFLSAAPSSNVVGHTCHNLLEFDEAQDISEDKVVKDFLPMAASTNATSVYYGTAWKEDDLLATVKARHLEQQRKDGVQRHFEYDWTRVAEEVPSYATYVARQQQLLGNDHPLFRTQYRLIPLFGGGRLLNKAQLSRMRGDHPRGIPQTDGISTVAGIDVGAEAFGNSRDHDRTICTIGQVVPSAVSENAVNVVDARTWQGIAHAAVLPELLQFLQQHRVKRITIDATGVGEGLASMLANRAWPTPVTRLRFTPRVKSDLGYALIAAASTERLKLWRASDDPELATAWQELGDCRMEAAENDSQLIRWWVDEARGHDDWVVSLALLIHAAVGVRRRVAAGAYRAP